MNSFSSPQKSRWELFFNLGSHSSKQSKTCRVRWIHRNRQVNSACSRNYSSSYNVFEMLPFRPPTSKSNWCANLGPAKFHQRRFVNNEAGISGYNDISVSLEATIEVALSSDSQLCEVGSDGFAIWVIIFQPNAIRLLCYRLHPPQLRNNWRRSSMAKNIQDNLCKCESSWCGDFDEAYKHNRTRK